jgi:hypothetical protein
MQKWIHEQSASAREHRWDHVATKNQDAANVFSVLSVTFSDEVRKTPFMKRAERRVALTNEKELKTSI